MPTLRLGTLVQRLVNHTIILVAEHWSNGTAGVSGGATPAARALASGDAGFHSRRKRPRELSCGELFVRARRVAPAKRQRTKSDHQRTKAGGRDLLAQQTVHQAVTLDFVMRSEAKHRNRGSDAEIQGT